MTSVVSRKPPWSRGTLKNNPKSAVKILPTAMIVRMEIIGASSGRVMLLICCHLLAPSILAAS
ncbi:hypothetical protein D3C75_1289100 [compost metagenome]